MMVIRRFLWIVPVVIGLVFVAAGAYTISEGFGARNLIRAELADEQVKTSDTASIPGAWVTDVATAEVQAATIKEHTFGQFGPYSGMGPRGREARDGLSQSAARRGRQAPPDRPLLYLSGVVRSRRRPASPRRRRGADRGATRVGGLTRGTCSCGGHHRESPQSLDDSCRHRNQ
jgi:hypothetical protein